MNFSIENFQKLHYPVNFILPVGAGCYPAEALRANGLRYFATPFDWMFNYSLTSVIDLLITNEKFFAKYEINKIDKKTGNYHLMDVETGMIAMHHINSNDDFDKQYLAFRTKMIKRFNFLISAIQISKSFGIISRRTCFTELLNFMDSLMSLFPKKQIIILNVENRNYDNLIIWKMGAKSILYNIGMNDIHPVYSWKGNDSSWNQLLKIFDLIKLPDSFVKAQYCKNNEWD